MRLLPEKVWANSFLSGARQTSRFVKPLRPSCPCFLNASSNLLKNKECLTNGGCWKHIIPHWHRKAIER